MLSLTDRINLLEEDFSEQISANLPKDVSKAMRAFSDDILISVVRAHGGVIEIPADLVDHVTDELSVHVDDGKIILRCHPKEKLPI